MVSNSVGKLLTLHQSYQSYDGWCHIYENCIWLLCENTDSVKKALKMAVCDKIKKRTKISSRLDIESCMIEVAVSIGFECDVFLTISWSYRVQSRWFKQETLIVGSSPNVCLGFGTYRIFEQNLYQKVGLGSLGHIWEPQLSVPSYFIFYIDHPSCLWLCSAMLCCGVKLMLVCTGLPRGIICKPLNLFKHKIVITTA